jgi:alkanesulfonate monooxygenase SsuD/methylene tetrahydromethanopterin reductase-like flavin-dependent oxidoreductase (luciferase family)
MINVESSARAVGAVAADIIAAAPNAPAAAKAVAESFHRINSAYPGRFVLGIGVGRPEVHGQYRSDIE